ncbi:EpsI family protein [Zoogloeaceae bacterium G21618-S1]|nr:EpsI family protein [Zoogloeaceae bacterium G21618-S1]
MTHTATLDASAQTAGTLTRRAIIAALIMGLAAALAWLLTPTYRLADENPVNLESMIPTAFGDWQVDANAFAGVVNPQQTELINRLYSQTLSRTYKNTKTGDRIMLSIAYGEDQRDGMQMHYPEVCYPAQGFEVRSNTVGELAAASGPIPVRRLKTVLNNSRFEPVTYWTMLGDTPQLGGVKKKIAEMRYGLRGQIVDGLLFRVSSIDRDSSAAFGSQEAFVRDMLASLSAPDRHRLSGN